MDDFVEFVAIQAGAVVAARQRIVEGAVGDRDTQPVVNTGTLYP
ncbi:hypothetical protein ACWDRB_44315 [Nonomuraea sp. NPDC003707]